MAYPAGGWLVAWAMGVEAKNWDDAVKRMAEGIRFGSLAIAALAGLAGGTSGATLVASIRVPGRDHCDAVDGGPAPG